MIDTRTVSVHNRISGKNAAVSLTANLIFLSLLSNVWRLYILNYNLSRELPVIQELLV